MDRFGRFWAAVPPLIGLSILHVMVFSVQDGTGFLIICTLMALANGLGSGIILTIGADLAPANARNEFLATYRLITDFGVAVAPPMLSVIASISTLAISMASFGALGLVGSFLMWRYIPRFIPKN
jgi:MFS-type transporter involved in bile tolerance (Atg22 family)